ncbi:MAG: HRDC domain-containing protein [Lactobacillales bacterium]|jgi:ATP-dependent DNA helicase RecQ|nr:HRDC domain-containing protein [Lactobacillales bacterium]
MKQILPFWIFSNATLEDFCKKLPQNEIEFLECKGVGTAKLEGYSSYFLPIIQQYVFIQSCASKKKEELFSNIEKA